MNRLVLAVIAGLVAVLVCLIMLNIEIDGSDGEEITPSRDPTSNKDNAFEGTVEVEGQKYGSFEKAVEEAKKSESKTVTFTSDSKFYAKDPTGKTFNCWKYGVYGLTIDLGGRTITT